MKRGHPYIDVFGKGFITMEKAIQTSQKTDQELSSVQFLTITAVFVALTYIFTAFINVKLPIAANGGLIHLGNVPLFIGAILFGKKTGAIAGGIGMGLFDLLSGWTLWAPFTLIIVGIMGFTVGKITEDHKHQNMKWYVIAIAAACVIKVVGYYIAEVIIYGNPLAPQIFHSRKPGTDRCRSSYRSRSDHSVKPCCKKNRIKKIAYSSSIN